MANLLDEISEKLDTVLQRLSDIENKPSNSGPVHIPFTQFCKSQNITRLTGYAWAERGLIKTEMIGGRRFVLSDSVLVASKYQREDKQALVHTM